MVETRSYAAQKSSRQKHLRGPDVTFTSGRKLSTTLCGIQFRRSRYLIGNVAGIGEWANCGKCQAEALRIRMGEKKQTPICGRR